MPTPTSPPSERAFSPPSTEGLNLSDWWVEALNDHFNPDGPTYLTDSVYAVLCNDLEAAMAKCDLSSQRALPDLVWYMKRHNNRNAWGSKSVVDEWVTCKHAGLARGQQ
jgi:hypothetical protein